MRWTAAATSIPRASSKVRWTSIQDPTFNLTSSGGSDVFVSKLDSDGNFVWAKSMGGTGFDFGFGIAVDGSGNVHTTGQFRSTTADFDPGPGTFNLTSSGSSDVFVSKLDSSGNFVWAKSMGSSLSFGIAVDGSGNVHTTGSFSGTADFDPGPGTFNLTSSGDLDVFVSKLDSNGNFVWAKSMRGTGFDQGRSIAVDGSGNVHTTGSFSGTADFDPGPGTFNLFGGGNSKVFVSKLDSDGNFVWAKSMGGPRIDQGLGIAVDGSGNVHTTGSFDGTADFDPGPGTFNLTSSGSDIFVSKLGHLQLPQLTVIKTVVTDDSGTAVAGDWTMDITGTNVTNTGFPGAESPGVTITQKPF